MMRLRGCGIGFVFQPHNLFPAFTAAENVMMPMLLNCGWGEAAMRGRPICPAARRGVSPSRVR